MWTWIFSNVQNLVSVAAIIGWAGVGLLALLGVFSKNKDDRRQESDAVADTLINRLKLQVDQMQKDMDANTSARDEEIKTLRSQVDHLSGRNAVLEDLFKGRDPQMQAFFKQSPELFNMAEKNSVLITATSEGIQKLTDTLARFIDTLQPILVHIETSKA